MAFASTAVLTSESCGTNDYIFVVVVKLSVSFSGSLYIASLQMIGET